MSRTPAAVVCIGIATLDAIVVVERLPGSDERVPGLDGVLTGGGVAATAAVALARLGIAVRFVGRIGDDAPGRLIRDGLAAEGVQVTGLRHDAARSPVSTILVEAGSGNRAIAPYLGDAAPIDLADGDLAACAAARWIHLDDLGLAILPRLAEAAITTDVSVDDGVGTRSIAFDQITLYGPTAAVLARRFPAGTLEASAEACLAAGPRAVVATLGSDGSLVSERDADGSVRHSRVPAWPVDVVSTLGAGDVFHGALLAGLVEGRAVTDAAEHAAAAAAMSCRALDGRSAIPSAGELAAWIADRDPARD